MTFSAGSVDRTQAREELIKLLQENIRSKEHTYGAMTDKSPEFIRFYGYYARFLTDFAVSVLPVHYDPQIVGVHFLELDLDFRERLIPVIEQFTVNRTEIKLIVFRLAQWAIETISSRYELDLMTVELKDFRDPKAG